MQLALQKKTGWLLSSIVGVDCTRITMEGSEIGVVRLLRDEVCHRWWTWEIGSYPWHSFGIREEVQLFKRLALLAGVIPNDPSVAPSFVDSRESLEKGPVPEGWLNGLILVLRISLAGFFCLVLVCVWVLFVLCWCVWFCWFLASREIRCLSYSIFELLTDHVSNLLGNAGQKKRVEMTMIFPWKN